MKEIIQRKEVTEEKTGALGERLVRGLTDKTPQDDEIDIKVTFALTSSTPTGEVSRHFDAIIEKVKPIIRQAIKPGQIDLLDKKGAA